MSPVTLYVNTVAEGRVASAAGGEVGWMDGEREAAKDGWMEGKSTWRALDEY